MKKLFLTALLIVMDHVLKSMNIEILPSSFYPEKDKTLLTEESIKRDLELLKKVRNGKKD